ncbi:MAG: NAD(P)H-dependent oxidoreductase [Firmicutes bacterium]|nr:NAD(P)H-dependent oxidoreductase [Bacillota bacterium]
MKTLVVYYSQARGNTKRIAEMIQKAHNADIAQINTVKPYTGSYDDIVNQGQEEVTSGFMPEIKPLSADISAYENIVVCTPTWWYTMAPAVKTFLTENDLKGKKIAAVQTHGGWPGHVFADVKKLCKTRTMKTLSVQFDSTGGDKLVTDMAELEKEISELL